MKARSYEEKAWVAKI